ncbi:protein aubergine-like [Phlebotomus argentipes]|uniref:protein aubergine-like n=1 Tax=Phlebotomus argentipes TaxID=94469 RepID=UPI002892FC5F|nr:protein aubergine-like [Phlebotomus argentipes]
MTAVDHRGRGRRTNRAITDLTVTRPPTMESKRGQSGSSITVLANYFRVLKKPEWNIYKYHVDFAPQLEQLTHKKAIMRRHVSKLGSFQFDGNMIYSPFKFGSDPLIIVDKDENDEMIQITIRFVGTLLSTDGQYTHLLNLIMRATIESLNMQRAYGPKGTKYFDALQKIDINTQHLQVWPGFCTAIRQHERDIMICTELTHKVIRMENCYNVMQHYARDQQAVKKELIGKVVVTEYNNSTYRIDDVDFALSPSSSFVKKNGERTTFLQYFRDRYNCNIRDTRQPLLVSRAKAKDVRAGRPEVLNLVPELCRLTGLTEEMRTNFRLMRDLAQHTRIKPDLRVKRYLELNRRIHCEDKAREVMKKWEMDLDRHLVEFPARVLPTETIFFGDRREERPVNADWTGAMTRNKLFETDRVSNWHCICTNRDYSQGVARPRAYMRNVINKFAGNKASNIFHSIHSLLREFCCIINIVVVDGNCFPIRRMIAGVFILCGIHHWHGKNVLYISCCHHHSQDTAEDPSSNLKFSCIALQRSNAGLRDAYQIRDDDVASCTRTPTNNKNTYSCIVQKFVGFMLTSARNVGLSVADPRIIRIDNPRVQAYINAIEQACNDSTQIILCVVPNQDANRYGAIKKRACVDRAVPTQAVLTKVLSNEKILKSVSAKIMVQMNCKLGNVPWTVKIPASGIMTVGFDVTYDVRDKRKSYGALVATMDLRQCNSYFSTVSQHTHGEEMSNFLVVNMMKALKQYQHIHQDPPKRIIFYRDGVGDGDVTHVMDHEVRRLSLDLKTMFGESAPKLTFIIVTKRINTRLFTKDMRDFVTNAPPGTVVDDVITQPERYDFFIVSQCTKEGTIAPTSYNVVFDESGFSPDKIQIWTYKMTHLYYNWSGNVKVPAVCQYAQKLAFLVGQYINQEPTHLLERNLYFL